MSIQCLFARRLLATSAVFQCSRGNRHLEFLVLVSHYYAQIWQYFPQPGLELGRLGEGRVSWPANPDQLNYTGDQHQFLNKKSQLILISISACHDFCQLQRWSALYVQTPLKTWARCHRALRVVYKVSIRFGVPKTTDISAAATTIKQQFSNSAATNQQKQPPPGILKRKSRGLLSIAGILKTKLKTTTLGISRAKLKKMFLYRWYPKNETQDDHSPRLVSKQKSLELAWAPRPVQLKNSKEKIATCKF